MFLFLYLFYILVKYTTPSYLVKIVYKDILDEIHLIAASF
jgi:hypothetical protein